MKFSGKNALVIGGGAGIGAAIACELARACASVTIADLSEKAMAKARSNILAAGYKVQTRRVDLGSKESVAALADWTLGTTGAPDLLIITAVDYTSVLGGIDEVQVDAWKASFEVNFFGYVRALEAFLPAMLEREDGTVVLTSSTVALLPDPSIPILLRYAAIKHAILGLSQALAAALNGSGVNSVCFCPSATNTENAVESVRASKFSAVAGQIASGADPAAVARKFVEGLANGEFLICSHSGYRDKLVDVARKALDPIAYRASAAGHP